MSEERRKADRRIPPAVAQHAIEERAELLARIEGLVSKNDTLNRTNLELCDQLHSALKPQPSGVVLPEPFEMRPFQTVDQGCTNYKAGFNAAIRKVRESLNSHPVIAGVVDERSAFNAEYDKACGRHITIRELAWRMWKARAAQPDHSAQILNMVPDAVVVVGFDVVDRQHIPTINISLPACAVDDQAAWNRRDDVAASIRSMLAAPAPGKQEGE